MGSAVQCSKDNSSVPDSPCPQSCKHQKQPYTSVKSHYIQPRPLPSWCHSHSKNLSGSENLTHHCQLNHAWRTWKRRKLRPHITSAQHPSCKPLPWQVLFFSSYPALHKHFPMGTSHSPSALQCIFGASSVTEWLTQTPDTSSSCEESAPVMVSGKRARLRTTDGHFL